MSELSISLKVEADGSLRATYVNGGSRPLALAFWWNRQLRVVDAQGAVVAPGPGPVLPCGVAEEWTALAPGQKFERAESLGCTQPAGRDEKIGWSYGALPAGKYRVSVVFEAPAAHGFSQSEPNVNAFNGRVESNEVTITFAEKSGFFARLFGK